MSVLLLILFPILLVDVMNPILFAAVLYGLGSAHPIRNSSGILLSFFISYFISGLLFALGFDLLGDRIHWEESLDYAIELIVGFLLIYIGWSQYRSRDVHPEEKLNHPSSMSFSQALWLGLQVNVIGLPLALPYFAAIDQILKADLNFLSAITILLSYNVLYVAPFLAVVAIPMIYHQESRRILESINNWMDYLCVKWLPWAFIMMGAILLEDCISYFLGYREYSLLSLY